jgi:hypothetical protein
VAFAKRVIFQGMNQSHIRLGSRTMTLIVVLLLHVAIIARLLLPSTPSVFKSSDAPVELMLIAPTPVPRVRFDHLRPRAPNVNVVIAPLPPDLNPSQQSASQSTGRGNNGLAVNWAAEARRAVEAYEIRRDRPPNNVIAGASRDEWWPQRGHHAGDRYKTENGDWIVWIDANCYQIASWHPGDPQIGVPPLRTICPSESAPATQ